MSKAMADRLMIAGIILVVGGTKVAAWVTASITGNFWWVGLWFGIAICVAAAGGGDVGED